MYPTARPQTKLCRCIPKCFAILNTLCPRIIIFQHCSLSILYQRCSTQLPASPCATAEQSAMRYFGNPVLANTSHLFPTSPPWCLPGVISCFQQITQIGSKLLHDSIRSNIKTRCPTSGCFLTNGSKINPSDMSIDYMKVTIQKIVKDNP